MPEWTSHTDNSQRALCTQCWRLKAGHGRGQRQERQRVKEKRLRDRGAEEATRYSRAVVSDLGKCALRWAELHWSERQLVPVSLYIKSAPDPWAFYCPPSHPLLNRLLRALSSALLETHILLRNLALVYYGTKLTMLCVCRPSVTGLTTGHTGWESLWRLHVIRGAFGNNTMNTMLYTLWIIVAWYHIVNYLKDWQGPSKSSKELLVHPRLFTLTLSHMTANKYIFSHLTFKQPEKEDKTESLITS